VRKEIPILTIDKNQMQSLNEKAENSLPKDKNDFWPHSLY
jgi:hypothetical protein